MNILLIEDDAGLVELMSANLQELGFSVISAASGAQALEHLKKHTPDLILLDFSLPDINGKELIETLIKEQNPPPPFIITTGQGDEHIAVNMMKLGAMDYLIKDMLFLEKLPDVVTRVIKEIESDGKLKQAEEALKKSEASIRNKLKAITEPKGDIETLELSDIIDTEILQSMMDDFYQLTGMLGAVLDVSGKVLVAVGWQDICTKFHRCNPDTLKNCIESDTLLTQGVPEGTFKSYHCKNNMWDIVTPIMIGGKHVGNVFMGQYFLQDEEPDIEFFRKQAKKHGFDEKEYLTALDRVPHFSKETVDAGMQFYSKLAGIISTLSYSSIIQSRMLAQQKLSDQALKESEERIRLFTQNVPDFLLQIDRIGKINYINKTFEGLTQKDVIGTSVYSWIPKESSEEFKDKVEKVFRSGSNEIIEYHSEGPKGKEPIWFETQIGPFEKSGIITQVIIVARDITERKKEKEKALSAEEKLKNTFDLSPSIIAKANLDTGYFIEANQAVTRILGYSIEEFTSKPFIELIHPDDQQKSTDEKDEQLDGKEVTFFENRYLCKDGSYKWMAWHGTKADKHGVVTAIGSDISKRKIIEDEIIETKQFYENITEGVQDGIWVTDKNDIIFYANTAVEKIAGVPREQIQGNNLLKDFPKETTGELIKYYKQAKKEKKPIWYDIKVRTLANKDTWQNGWLIPQYQDKKFTGIICTIRDVTERKKAESSVRRLSTAVEQSPSIIVITGTNGKLEYVNPKFTELTGYSSAEAIGQESNILKSGEQDAAFYEKMWETIESGKIWKGQFQNKKKNGDLFWEAASISAILNESGDVINFIKIGEDITQQKNAETDLKSALAKAMESDRLKSAFLTNMSHEIRTPMNGILGFINLLNEPDLSKDEIAQYTGVINRGGERLLNTINDIIDISRIEAGEIVISKTETSINNIMDELYAFYSHQAKQKGLSLLLESHHSNEQITIITDSHKLHGVLTNLIKNAIKFTKKGHITFGYLIKENSIDFFVKDTGIGIPKSRTQAIFNRFEQADIEDAMAFEGSGLGLAISKAYVEMLGGEIFVESDEGQGSKFIFTIPYVKQIQIS